MTAKQYIDEEKEKYATADDWAEAQFKDHFIAMKNGEIELINENYIKELVNCRTWEEALEIAFKYIV